MQFLLRYARYRSRLLDIALPLQCVVMPVTSDPGRPERLYTMASFWYTLLALQMLAAAAFYLRTQSARDARSFWPWRCCCASLRWR